MRAKARRACLRGDYSVVEGPITNFHPMPYSGHQDESFSVTACAFHTLIMLWPHALTIPFSRWSDSPSAVRVLRGLHLTAGSQANAMPSPELRTSTVERAECEWQQQMERHPWMDRMTFGFAIAELFMTAWWN